MQFLYLGGCFFIKFGVWFDDYYWNIVIYGLVLVIQYVDQSLGDFKVFFFKDGVLFFWEGCVLVVEVKDVEEEVGNEEVLYGGFFGGVFKDKGDVLYVEIDVIGRGRVQVIVEDINVGVVEVDVFEFVVENVDIEVGVKELVGD